MKDTERVDLDTYRKDFEQSANRSVSLPIAGAIVWLAVGLLSTQLGERMGVLVLMIGSGAIFPIGLLIAQFRHFAYVISISRMLTRPIDAT